MKDQTVDHTLEDESVDASPFDETAKVVDQVTTSAGKWAGYFAGYCVRVYHDAKDSVSKVNLPHVSMNTSAMSSWGSSFGASLGTTLRNSFGGLRGVDFNYLFKRDRQDEGSAGGEGQTAEFYEHLGRDIFEMAKSAKTNENLTIISTAKYR